MDKLNVYIEHRGTRALEEHNKEVGMLSDVPGDRSPQHSVIYHYRAPVLAHMARRKPAVAECATFSRGKSMRDGP